MIHGGTPSEGVVGLRSASWDSGSVASATGLPFEVEHVWGWCMSRGGSRLVGGEGAWYNVLALASMACKPGPSAGSHPLPLFRAPSFSEHLMWCGRNWLWAGHLSSWQWCPSCWQLMHL